MYFCLPVNHILQYMYTIISAALNVAKQDYGAPILGALLYLQPCSFRTQLQPFCEWNIDDEDNQDSR